METSNDKRLVFGAMALFFFVFLESTLFFQTSLGMIVDSAAGSLLQFPIQGASALGLLLFSALNRIMAPRIRSTAVGFLTLLGIASLVGRRWLRCVFPYRPCRRCRILGSVQSPTNKCALRNVHWSEPRFGHCCPNPVLQPYPQSLWGSTAAFGKHRDLGRCRCESIA